MSFKDRDFVHRLGSLGDEAEKVAEEHYPDKLQRYGFNRPTVSMSQWPAFIRYTPDYIAFDHLLEVQGCGKGRTWAFKLEKIEALSSWSLKMPVDWFLWDNVERRWCAVTHAWVVVKADDTRALKRFPDNNKPYIEVHVDEVPTELWTYVT